jgi:hypothetical protein
MAVQIVSAKPNVSESDALRIFSSFGFGRLFWTLRHGRLERIASVYVPFWLYRARYRMNRTEVSRFFALDAVDGSLDPFEFPGLPAAEQLVSLSTRNCFRAQLDPETAKERLREKILRIVFQQGFFKLRNVQLEITRDPLEIHMPYWLAFYGNSRATGSAPVRCRVLDGVRRKLEGAKACVFFEHWLGQ